MHGRGVCYVHGSMTAMHVCTQRAPCPHCSVGCNPCSVQPWLEPTPNTCVGDSWWTMLRTTCKSASILRTPHPWFNIAPHLADLAVASKWTCPCYVGSWFLGAPANTNIKIGVMGCLVLGRCVISSTNRFDILVRDHAVLLEHQLCTVC